MAATHPHHPFPGRIPEQAGFCLCRDETVGTGQVGLVVAALQYLLIVYNYFPQNAHITAQHVLSYTTGLPNWLEPNRIFFALPEEQFGYSGGRVYLPASRLF